MLFLGNPLRVDDLSIASLCAVDFNIINDDLSSTRFYVLWLRRGEDESSHRFNV